MDTLMLTRIVACLVITAACVGAAWFIGWIASPTQEYRLGTRWRIFTGLGLAALWIVTDIFQGRWPWG